MYSEILKQISVKELSELTGIAENTLYHILHSEDNFNKTPFQKVMLIDETLILTKFHFYKRHTERVYKVNESPEAILKNRQFTVNFEEQNFINIFPDIRKNIDKK